MSLKLSQLDERLRARITAQLAAEDSARAAVSHPQQRERPEALAGRGEREAQGTRLPHCRFTLVRKRLLDVDAKYASVKDLLDGLAIAGIIPGDKEGQITLEVPQRRTGKGEPEQTIIEVI